MAARSFLALSLAVCVHAREQVRRLGPYTVTVGNTDRLLVVRHDGEEVLASLPSSQPFLVAAHGPWATATRQGNVNVTDALVARTGTQTVDEIRAAPGNKSLTLSGVLRGHDAELGDWRYVLRLAAVRWRWTLPAVPGWKGSSP